MNICPHCGSRDEHKVIDGGVFHNDYICNHCKKHFKDETIFYDGVKKTGAILLVVASIFGIVDHDSGSGNSSK